ncbi:MAG: UPF0280 family protein [Bacillota bacterium]|jgi:ApbE superfamily uncharacterized protein (UPF0280 family)
MYVERDYRRQFGLDLKTYYLTVKETDLAICLPQGFWYDKLQQKIYDLVSGLRGDLEHYIALDEEFLHTHQPYSVSQQAPAIAKAMAAAANKAGIGPMSAVAGAFSQAVGQFLLPITKEVVVENGGDIYMAGQKDRLVGIFAGNSPFSNKLAIKISARNLPLGICTSSGTVGPSFSYGVADAAVIISPDTLLADAVATAAGNLVQSRDDVGKAAEFAMSIQGITAVLIIKDNAIAAVGDIELAPL